MTVCFSYGCSGRKFKWQRAIDHFAECKVRDRSPTGSMNVTGCSSQPHRLAIPVRKAQAPMFGPCSGSARSLSVGFQCGSINWPVGSVMHRKASFRHVANDSGLEKETSFQFRFDINPWAQSWANAVLFIDHFQPLLSQFFGSLNSQTLVHMKQIHATCSINFMQSL